jgi:hypothetical protein
MRFLVALNVGSQTRLSIVKVFDDVEPVPYGTPRGTGGPACTTVIIVMEPSSHIALSPRCVENYLMKFITSKYHIYVQYNSAYDNFINTFIILDPVETSIKSWVLAP